MRKAGSLRLASMLESQMRPLLSSIAIALILVLSGCSRNTDSLSFQLPPDWKLEHKEAGGRNFYMAGANTPGEGSFMLSPWLQPTKPEEIPTAVRGIADSFSKQAPLSGIVLASRDYRVENFNGAEGPGSYAVFQISYGGKNSIQAMFMLGVSNRVWYGQFIGLSNSWPQALTILKSARKDRQP